MKGQFIKKRCKNNISSLNYDFLFLGGFMSYWLKEQDEVEELEEKEIDEIETEEGAENLLENDEITSGEAGFEEGYADLKSVKKCKNCGNEIDLEKSVEVKIGDHEHLFCSVECADEFKEKHSHKE